MSQISGHGTKKATNSAHSSGIEPVIVGPVRHDEHDLAIRIALDLSDGERQAFLFVG